MEYDLVDRYYPKTDETVVSVINVRHTSVARSTSNLAPSSRRHHSKHHSGRHSRRTRASSSQQERSSPDNRSHRDPYWEDMGDNAVDPNVGQEPVKEEIREFHDTPKEARHMVILVMGGTGAGKSSFVAKVTGAPVKIGKKLESCTNECQGVDLTYDSGTTITLVDTPGFNDQQRPDLEVLDTIVNYIEKQPYGQIAGIIYLHRITDRRIFGSSRLNLRLLEAMCGRHFCPNIVFVTTMWDKIPNHLLSEAESREVELNFTDVFWKDMQEKGGAKYTQYNDTVASGQQILGICLAQPPAPALQIVLERQQGYRLDQTSAGMILTEELRKREERERQEIAEEEEAERQKLLRLKAEKQAQLQALQNNSRNQADRGARGMGYSRREEEEHRRHENYHHELPRGQGEGKQGDSKRKHGRFS